MVTYLLGSHTLSNHEVKYSIVYGSVRPRPVGLECLASLNIIVSYQTLSWVISANCFMPAVASSAVRPRVVVFQFSLQLQLCEITAEWVELWLSLRFAWRRWRHCWRHCWWWWWWWWWRWLALSTHTCGSTSHGQSRYAGAAAATPTVGLCSLNRRHLTSSCW